MNKSRQGSKSLERKLRYPQPYSIKCPGPSFFINPALEYHLIMKEHGRLKYESKRRRSKYSKRMY